VKSAFGRFFIFINWKEEKLAKILELLERLQEIDLRLDRLRYFIEHFSDFLAELGKEEEEIKKFFEEKKRNLEELKKQRSRKELDLQEGEEHIKKCSTRLYTVKSNKEYDALLKEIETQKEKNSQIETELLILYDQIDDEEKKFKEAQKESTQAQEEVLKRKKGLEEKLNRAKALLPEVEKEREGLIGSITKGDALEQYQWLQEKLGVKVMSRVVEEVCQNCYRRIPSQIFNEVLSGEKVITCPGCNRIMVCREKEFIGNNWEF